MALRTQAGLYLSCIHSRVANIFCGSGLSEPCAIMDVVAGTSRPGSPDAGDGDPAAPDAGTTGPGTGNDVDAGPGVESGEGGGCNSGTGGAGLLAGSLGLPLVARRRRTLFR